MNRATHAASQRLLEIADEAHSTTERAVVQAILRKDSPTHVAAAQPMHTHIPTMVCFAEWACHNRVEADPVVSPDNCDMAFPALRQHIDRLAAKVIDAESLGHLEGIVTRHQERHPI